MSVKVESILVLVFGATTGATLHEFLVDQGYRQIWKRNIPWIIKDSVYLWPMDWLKDLLNEVKTLATSGTIIVSAMWGADVVHLDFADSVIDPVLHYRSIPPEFSENLISTSDISKQKWSELMGHVHALFYQMVFSSCFWRAFTGNKLKFLRVIPMADWITWYLSGQKGHDPAMLYNQGAGVSTSKLVNGYFDSSNKFAPIWPLFHSSQLLEIDNDAYLVPCTHDSALARTVLASTDLPWGLWTGSWYGIFRTVSDSDLIMPGIKTFDAGLVFEAMPNNALSAISNIGLHGPLYKALRDVNGEISYEEAAQMALHGLNQIDITRRIYDDKSLALKPDVFASVAIRLGELDIALATMVNTIAMKCKSGLLNASQALGVSMPDKVTIVGGFAENPAILKALQMRGINAVVPPFAGLATQAGAAAEALRRAGMAKDTKQALTMFPDVELTK